MRRISWLNLSFTLLCLFSVACKRAEDKVAIVDIKAIVNREPTEVEEILGAPDSIYTIQMMGKSIFCQRYESYNMEIQYPQSRATDIVVYGPVDLPFDQTALAAFNLDYRKQHPSDYRKGSYIRWSDFEEFSAISFYNTRKDSLNSITAFDIFFKAKEVQ